MTIRRVTRRQAINRLDAFGIGAVGSAVHSLSRRKFLIAGGAGATLAAVSSCSFFSTDPADESNPTDTPGAGGNEAPDLAAKVAAGELPPLAERLPANPLVVEPNDRVGSYGGTWNSALLGPADEQWLQRTVGYEPLLRWNVGWTEPIPNVAESVQQSDDGREFVIKLREGMKWSDGEPLTADDLMFAYEDGLRNDELFPVVQPYLVNGGEVATLTKVDDVTVQVMFAAPNGLFLDQLALLGSGEGLIHYPRHYLEAFHPTYSEGVDALAKDEGFGDWTELFLARLETYQNAERPVLEAWKLTTALGDGTTVVAERNPYYWKVDPDGKQLPYIDTVSYEVTSDAEVILLKATNGELSFHTRHINDLANKPVLADGRESGDYEFTMLRSSFMNEMVVFFNLTHEDEVKREIFNNVDFRIGLSYAINRPELNTAVFQDEGEPWQAAPTPESRFYNEGLATQYVEYDVELANEALDRAGYSERNGDGFRLGPDGEPITIEVEVADPGVVPYWLDTMNLVAGYWQEVGIDTRTRPEDRSLFVERATANQRDAAVWVGPGGFGDETRRPFFYLPNNNLEQAWAPLWTQWYLSNGEQGEEPPAAPKRQFELFRQLAESPEPEARDDLFREIIQIAQEQFYVIGTIRIPAGYGIVSNTFRNVPAEMPDSFDYATPAATNPCQYFIEA